MPTSGVLSCQSHPADSYGILLLNMSPKNQFGVIRLQIYLKDMEKETGINLLYLEKNETVNVKVL